MNLVTGGTGLVGSHVAFYLAANQKPVRLMLRDTAGIKKIKKVFSYYHENPDALFSSVEVVVGDITDINSIGHAIHDVEHVYHCAGYVSFDSREKDKLELINTTGTKNMVNMALDSDSVKKFGFVSSVAALHCAEGKDEVDESCFLKPPKQSSHYARTKYAAEMEVWRGIHEGLDGIIINPTIILGPGNWEQGSASIFSNLYKGMRYYTPGSTGFVDVNDVARLFIQLLESDIANERFLINSENVGFKEVFQQIASEFNNQSASKVLPAWLGDLAWRGEKLMSSLTGKSVRITKDSMEAAFNKKNYVNEKVLNAVPCEFMKVKESIQTNCKRYLNDVQSEKNSE